MLYLEDYLERKHIQLVTKIYSRFVHSHLIFVLCKISCLVIEHLPQETCDRLTDMRELDLQVQSKLSYYMESGPFISYKYVFFHQMLWITSKSEQLGFFKAHIMCNRTIWM